MIEVQEVYGVRLPQVVTIDRSKTFAEMSKLAIGKRYAPYHDPLAPMMREKYDLNLRKVTETVRVYGFTNERGMLTTTVGLELADLGFDPASIIHWLAFSALCPDELKEDPKVSLYALGGGYVSKKTERIIAVGKLHPSAVEVPFTTYYAFSGAFKGEVEKGPYRKSLYSRHITDSTRWKPREQIFLAVAKEGQG